MSIVTLPAKTWVNLYTAASITVGVQLFIRNQGVYDVTLSETEGGTPYALAARADAVNEVDDTGCWAFCQRKTELQVLEAGQ